MSPHNHTTTKHRISFNVLMKFSYIFRYIFSFPLCSPCLLSSSIAFVLFYYTRLWTQLCYHRNAAHSSFVYVYSRAHEDVFKSTDELRIKRDGRFTACTMDRWFGWTGWLTDSLSHTEPARWIALSLYIERDWKISGRGCDIFGVFFSFLFL
jgi:hypothetical protein